MDMKRREFLAKSIAGVGGLLLGSGCIDTARQKFGTFEPYERVPLGKTKIKVSRVGFGTGMRGGNRQSNQTRLGKDTFDALLKTAYERGVRLFDMADLYGTHPYLASALSRMPREDYVINTKMWWRSGGIPEKERPDADVVVKRFLKELNTDYIDVVLLHCVASERWPQELRRQMDILDELKHKGIIRAHGVSCHSLPALQAAADEPWVDSVNVRINAYGKNMDGPLEKVEPVVRKLHMAGKGVVGMKLIGEGAFRNSDEKRDNSVRYVLGLGCVDAMVVGFEKTEEVDDFAARVRKVPRNQALVATTALQPCCVT
ncbi:MAG TPA: aldo/keto reductase [Sedimentisphaerales bacterium]|nr:aldo/keto reductase [Sedimentisphaerales bacterium]